MTIERATLPSGEELELLRRVRAISQSETASRARITFDRARKIFGGQRQPTASEVARILGALSTDPDAE